MHHVVNVRNFPKAVRLFLPVRWDALGMMSAQSPCYICCRTPLIPASFPGKMVATFGADMTPIKRAAQPREVSIVWGLQLKTLFRGLADNCIFYSNSASSSLCILGRTCT